MNSNHDNNFFLVLLIRIIWFIFAIIIFMLILRIIFELLNAQNVGFTTSLYNFTDPFVAPFSGIFPSLKFGNSFLDTAALVGIIAVSLVGWIISALLNIFRRP